MNVIWKRHRSMRSIVAKYLAGPADLPAEEITAEMSNGESWGQREYVNAVRAMGMWAFCETYAKPPVVHYWHDGKRSLADLAMLLGHELGHISGKPYEGHSPKSMLREEMRADEYGVVAREVIRKLVGRRAR